MGGTIEKTIVLDFYGIPGSGKTTASHALAEEIRKKGHSVVEPSYELDHVRQMRSRKVRKLAMTALLSCHHPGVFKSVAGIVRKNGYTAVRERIRQIVNISSKLYMLARYDRRTEYLVFDEGLAQAAVSLSVNSRIGADDNFEQLMKLAEGVSEIRLIQVKLGIDEALARVSRRDSRDTRIEALRTADEREALMKRYELAVAQIGGMEPSRGVIRHDVH